MQLKLRLFLIIILLITMIFARQYLLQLPQIWEKILYSLYNVYTHADVRREYTCASEGSPSSTG